LAEREAMSNKANPRATFQDELNALRPATIEERQKLLEAIHSLGGDLVALANSHLRLLNACELAEGELGLIVRSKQGSSFSPAVLRTLQDAIKEAKK
jgi:hypothetical protein